MKSIYLLMALFHACFLGISAQDMFTPRPLSFEPAQEGFATWSPDGSKIAFTSTRSGSFDIWIMEVDAEKIKKEMQVQE